MVGVGVVVLVVVRVVAKASVGWITKKGSGDVVDSSSSRIIDNVVTVTTNDHPSGGPAIR